MAEATCSIDGCERAAEKRGWCGAHYKRWRRHGHPLAGRVPPNPGQPCSVDVCSELAIAHRLCHRHYKRWKAYGDPLAGPRFRARRGSQAGANCSIEGCGALVIGRGWCRKHYQRWFNHGDPLFVEFELLRGVPAEERFWPFVNKDPSGCWLWTRRLNSSGYGTLTLGDGRGRLTHRFAYELLVGPIPERMTIDHLCRVRVCVNPEHLEVVTLDENLRRAQVAYKAKMDARTHCKRGHPWGDANTYINPNGSRVCRSCIRERRKRKADDGEAQPGRPPGRGDQGTS